jgi:hypothetical protein
MYEVEEMRNSLELNIVLVGIWLIPEEKVQKIMLNEKCGM